jgi:Got1/Sft2-like family
MNSLQVQDTKMAEDALEDASRMQPVSALDYYGVGQDPFPPDGVEAQEYAHSRALAGAASLVLTESPRRAQGQLDRGGVGGASESAAARLLLGADAADSRPLHLRCFPTCDWETRVMGFLSCFAIGLALSLSSLFSFPLILVGDPGPFAWKYSIGNLVSLASSVFLVGLRTQCELMASPVRIGASAAYVLSIAVTIIAALVLENALITIIAMVIQFCALAWYCASFIPFGRSMIRKCIGRYCCAV